jgi:LPS-assembly lipoprotein
MQRRLVLAAALVAGLGGCGFRLRGSVDLPFDTLYTNFASTSALGAELRRMIVAISDTRIVERREDAEAALIVLAEEREKEAIGFSTTGRPVEYELRLRTIFRLDDAKGRHLMPQTSLAVRREISVGEIQLLSKQLEEEQIFREMQSDMVQQMVRRLSSVQPLPPG